LTSYNSLETPFGVRELAAAFPTIPAVNPEPPTIALSPLDATLMDLPASIANKRLMVLLSSLDATLTKTGRGAEAIFH
jgi:hypothetical protein